MSHITYSAMENKKENCVSMSSGGLKRSERDLPPMHYSLKIESFSLLLKTKVEKYESDVFEAGGHKWRLCLYPNGNTKGIGKGFVSLYLQIENTSNLRHRWEVTTEFKLFVRDHINDKYLTVRESDASVKRFHEKKTERGFDQLLSLQTFNDASNGYLFNDCCVFGAEIFVIKPTGKGELLSMVKKPANGSLTWKIRAFSKLDRMSYSKAFTAGGRSWRIDVSPEGYGDGKGNSLSVFLELVGGGKLPPKQTSSKENCVGRIQATSFGPTPWQTCRTKKCHVGLPPPVIHVVSPSSCHWEISVMSPRAMLRMTL
eukprot:XP_024440730.1 uncharacterized protein LOC18105139 isoform X2 [Populus trichocarpa]